LRFGAADAVFFAGAFALAAGLDAFAAGFALLVEEPTSAYKDR